MTKSFTFASKFERPITVVDYALLTPEEVSKLNTFLAENSLSFVSPISIVSAGKQLCELTDELCWCLKFTFA